MENADFCELAICRFGAKLYSVTNICFSWPIVE